LAGGSVKSLAMPAVTTMLLRDDARQLKPQWNKTMIAASIAISFLGAFTSTQLMCHARMSLRLSSVFVWSMLGSLIFGFTTIWCLHFVAMLAFEFDLSIGIDAPLTILSAILAVSFTFMAIAADILWDRYRSNPKGKSRKPRSSRQKTRLRHTPSNEPLLQPDDHDEAYAEHFHEPFTTSPLPRRPSLQDQDNLAAFAPAGHSRNSSVSSFSTISKASDTRLPDSEEANGHASSSISADEELGPTLTSAGFSWLRPSSGHSSLNSFGLGSAIGLINPKSVRLAQDPSVSTAKSLYLGCTRKNVAKGFLWSLAITSMHYCGTFALRIPSGYIRLNVWLVVLSAIISWIVCTVGCILLSKMETHLPQQVLFSATAAAGVSAMHWTGMSATTFYSFADSSDVRGYPPALANAVVGIAFITCIVANVLLAHSATVSRNKLAEIVWTRKELWRTITQKENAEAAARARSEFIASASHEIRTPLHHLQGYSDLLAHTELTEEGRALLTAIQQATKTLSLITNNVLDWSKFERNTECSYRPVALDIRAVCESIVVLLPNVDEEARVELYVVVEPDVPSGIYLDETWIHRIFMNLLSNALKFTRHGYILLSVQMQNDNLVATVRDTGCGLDPAFIPEMWTPFKQGDVRGSARGTGLGLSIIKQLLHRMKGKIDVESSYELMEGVGPDRSGTAFSVTLPLQSTIEQRPRSRGHKPCVAIFARSQSRRTKGLTTSWEEFGFDVTIVDSVSEMDNETWRYIPKWRYIWAELDFLHEHPDQFELLLAKRDWLVLVPYNTNDSLGDLPGILTAPNFVMLPKPLIWHTFEKRIATSRQRQLSAAPTQALRFASEVEVLNDSAKVIDPKRPWPEKKLTILLVEDNPVNQKLGKKMLTSLGFNTILASDGVEAVDMLLKQDSSIDAVLMDQSMPRKDGVTATKEIRWLESEGKLTRRRPILALTAVVNSEARREFEDAGADDFLPKPLSLNMLKDTLEAYLPIASG
jgi:signal transduction histidine kinase/ActR/RegA family two-component response regulator